LAPETGLRRLRKISLLLCTILVVPYVACANAGKLRLRTELEQQLWSECSRLLANCVIYYNACVLSQLLEYAERAKSGSRRYSTGPMLSAQPPALCQRTI
jgi:hypothetical protein